MSLNWMTLAKWMTLALAVVSPSAVWLTACGDGEDGDDTQVVATTGVVAAVAGEVAGSDAEVAQLVPDGADPHSFSLSAEDRQVLEQADLVVANGAGLEAGIPIEDADAPTWTLTDHAGELLPFEGSSEARDPHVWMDPTRVAEALPSLADAMADADPGATGAYRHRAAAYLRRLRSLDRVIKGTLADVPRIDRELVTSHDALAYFAERYGFDVIATAFPASGAEGEASAARLDDVETAVRESGVPAIFAQEGDDPEVLDLVAGETGVELNYGLLVESPGPAGSYPEMLRRDAELIARALGR
jgi:zinc/manganese transport system substrate-binding protein